MKNRVFSYYFYRERMSWFLLAAMVLIPFIRVNDTPLLLFNLFEKKFFVFFKQVYPQDFYLFAILMVAFFVVFLVITYRYGRVFCGWVCPQTVFLEFVFKKIDKIIAKFTTIEIVKNYLKIGSYVLVSVFISFVFLSYLIGVGAVYQYIAHLSDAPIKYYLFNGIFSTIFFVVFSQIREKSCTLFCPYGRVQGIFYGGNTNTVVYDVNRGEPRGKLSRVFSASAKGDCIDCKLCVKACPTMIDIRNGIQLECINCNQCVDACNEVMSSINKPLDLISYNSWNNTESKKKFQFSWVDYGVIAVCLVPFALILGIFLYKTSFDVIIKRVPGTLYQTTANGNYTNLYNVQFINKSDQDLEVEMKTIEDNDAKINVIGGDFNVKGGSVKEAVFFLEIPKSQLTSRKRDISISFFNKDTKLGQVKANFLGPIN